MHVKVVEQSQIYNYIKGVINVAEVCSGDLMKCKIGKLHAFYELTRVWVVTETNLHLGMGLTDRHFKLAIALDESGDVVAFTTFTESWSHPHACGVNYIATLPAFRRQRLMHQLIESIKERYSDFSLCCDLDLVPYYTKQGFSLKRPEGTQISLSTANSAAIMPILSNELIMESPPILEILTSLETKYGKKLKRLEKNYHNERKRAEKNIVKEFQSLANS